MPISTARRAGLDSVRLQPARPLAIHHVPGPLTLAVVSIAWMRSLSEASRTAVVARHLDAHEAVRAARLPVPKRRHEWMAGRLAAKHAVCAHQLRRTGEGLSTRQVRIDAVADGPRAGRPLVNVPVQISLTHSADFAVAVCGPRAVGVDLERTVQLAAPLTQLLAQDDTGADGLCRPGLAAMPTALRWACKESVLKHFGFGLRVDTREVRLTGWHSDGRFTWSGGPDLCRREPAAAAPWAFGTWAREVDGYCLALMWR